MRLNTLKSNTAKKHLETYMIMKYLQPTATLLVALFFMSCTRPQINMTFEGFSNDTVIVTSVSIEDAAKDIDDYDLQCDTLLINNNRLEIPAADRPMSYIFEFRETDDGSPYYTRRQIEIETNPEDRLVYRVKRAEEQFEYTAKGNAYAEGKADFDRYILPISLEIDSYNRGVNENWAILNSLYDKRRALAAEWLRQNQQNPAAVFVMAFEVASDTTLAYYERMKPLIDHSVIKPIVEKRIVNAEKYVAMTRAMANIKEGAVAPQFTLQDDKGNEVALGSLRGRWVVLDFWGTWCGWCIKGIPDMKKAYEKHKSKCEFISIDCNESRDAWLKGLEKYEMPWIQLYNPRESSPMDDVSVKYAVEGYPTKFIISPEGAIYKIFVGETAEFYAELDRVVK